jgi:alkanesulfonate monooxygenase SsuD/methylene tetrahydromethanopterin reductase-like flavin-dependent oxidoreductase (luciferase family)
MVPNSLQYLAYWAGRTQRIDLGTLVVVLPWWNPVRLAHQVAFLDLLMEGREFRFGVGRGVSRDEFDALMIPQNDSRERMAETLDILDLALSGERFSYEGEIFHIPETSVRPQWRSNDLMKHVLGASTGPESMELLAKRGLDQLFVTGSPLEEISASVQQYNTIRATHGHRPSQPTVYMWGYCTPYEDEAEAAMGYFARYQSEAADHYGFTKPDNFKDLKGYERHHEQIQAAQGGASAPSGASFGKLQFIGTPEQILENARILQETTSNKEVVVLFQFGGISDVDAERSMRLFAREVLPELQRRPTPLHADAMPLAPQTRVTA